MRFISNTGQDRLFDSFCAAFPAGGTLNAASPALSLFAWEALRSTLASASAAQLLLPLPDALELHGGPADRQARNRLQAPYLANTLARWVETKAEIRSANRTIPQGLVLAGSPSGGPQHAWLGALALATDGLGLNPGNPMSLIQATETKAEASMLATLFEQQWQTLGSSADRKVELLAALGAIGAPRDAHSIYVLMLHALLGGEQALDEERVVNSATGIRDTAVWKKLYKFQRDGAVGVIEKLERFGGCILADSVGLGKTFEALAVIKYHELRNDRVLVLCPKRLRDNWTIYTANDRRNILAGDRFAYDVLNHTDLSRDNGSSGDIDLANVNWGNYDLVVIDESHNFRNKKSPRQGQETRYDRLMRRIIREGVKTRVLMLSATPVNNRLADLRNQISFVTEGNDSAMSAFGIDSVEATTRRAQASFNRWLTLEEGERTPTALVDMLGFDYFSLLDHLTIARSRRHIERYYGTKETGRFPDRLPPINRKCDVDVDGAFQSIAEINREIRRLNLSSYAPLRYVLPHRQAAYDAKYSTQIRGGESFFRQVDREESLIHLLRVNVLKRMESSVHSFALTVRRQLRDVEAMLARIESHVPELEEIDIDEVDFDDPSVEPLLVGRKVKVLLGDVDRIRWKQDLIEDRNRLATLCTAAEQIAAPRDAKLAVLREMIEKKCTSPTNAGNRKVIVFTAFADTATYLYDNLSGWARQHLGLEAALVTGSGRNQTTLPGLRRDLSSILTAFSPRSKERPEELAVEGTLDLLIATDCISEGQNLQDCDWLVNYDIHWNPVRIIQRFGRIDRLGSPNKQIQLVNFWPNMELEEYINLEQRVSGRMVLLDVSATGEENLIEAQSGDVMNDLEYRRKQLLKLQDAVIDMEDLSSGVSITDLTLTDLRIDLADYMKAYPEALESMPLGSAAVVATLDAEIPPGVVFCLRAEGDAADSPLDTTYPLSPHYLVHVRDDGAIFLPYTQAKRALDALKRLCAGRDLADAGAVSRHARATKAGEDMQRVQRMLSTAITSIAGRSEERAVESLFSPGGTRGVRGDLAGGFEFEVVAYLVILPTKDEKTP